MQKFIQYLESEKRSSPHTIVAYRSDLEEFERFISVAYELSNLAEVSQPMVRSWLASLLDQSRSVSTIHRKMASLQAYYRFLVKQGMIAVNPVKGISKPKKPSKLPEYLEMGQAEKMYGEMDSSWEEFRNSAILKLLYETGMRRSELLGLQWIDVDLDKGQVRVLGKRQKVRLIPLSAEMSNVLRQLYQENIKQFEGPRDYLFLGPKGEPMSTSQLYLIVKKKLSQWTTMRKRSPHILRHSFASHMLNQGADLNVIKEILGHSSLAATQVYTHINIEKLKGIHSLLHPRNKS